MAGHSIRAFALMLIATAGAPLPAGAQSGPREAIKIHGRWTIDVRNPDGSLVSHHEFDNALYHEGAQVLAGLLGRVYFGRGTWSIELTRAGSLNSPVAGPCTSSTGQGVSCFLFEQLAGPPELGRLKLNLAVNGLEPAGTFNLTGATQVTGGGAIEYVRTHRSLCVGELCASTAFKIFTEHQLAAPIIVTPNQIVQVTVVFSFSS